MNEKICTLALIVIALNLTFGTFRHPATTPSESREASAMLPHRTFVEVIGKVDRSGDRMRLPALGFLVKHDGRYEMIDYDRGSFFDIMPPPGMIMVIDTGREKIYSPVEVIR